MTDDLALLSQLADVTAWQADENDHLRVENERLRKALADLLSERRGSDVTEHEDETAVERIARGALDEKEGERG